jgi:sugar phosphate isomerase/epimerase
MASDSKYKFGFNVFNKPPEDFFEYAVETGLKHIEINLTKEHSCLTSFDSERINRLYEKAKENRIGLSLHLPYSLNIADNISMISKSNTVYMEKCVEFAVLINATHITTHIGNYYWFPVNSWKKRKALNRFIKRIEKILAACEKTNIIIALENVVPIPHGSEFYLLGDSIEDFHYIFEKLDSDNLRFCLDTGHANMAEGIVEYIENFKDKLVCIHYHDNKEDNDEHLVVGEGTIPWTEVAQKLKEINFNGPFISECRGIKPHEAAQKLQSFFDKI